jgi:predicted nucleotidyltransferase component of viral defense system
MADFSAPVIWTYSLETTIAEKLDAILSLLSFSSRMKDYYDLYYNANRFDFDGLILTKPLEAALQSAAFSKQWHAALHQWEI